MKAPKVLVTILFLFICIPSAFSQDEVSMEQAMQGLALRVLIMIIAAIIAYMAKALLLRRLNKLMLSESKKMVPEVEVAGKEVPAPKPLQVIEVDVDTELPKENTNRQKWMAQAKRMINRQFLVNLAIGLLYAIGFFFVFDGNSYILDIEYKALVTQEMDIETAASLIKPVKSFRFFVVLFLIWNFLQFVGNRYQLTTQGKGGVGMAQRILSIFFLPFQSFWSQAIGVLLLLHTLFYGVISMNAFLLLIVVVHLVLWRLLRTQGHKLINSKLLILRVFLIGKTSTFTFKHLARLWKYFGTYFTVADPSFYKVRWKRKFNYMFPLYIVVVFFIYTLITDPNRDQEVIIFVVFIFLLGMINIAMVTYQLIRMKRNFMSSPAALEQRLEQLENRPTKTDFTFKEAPVMCYDNTWKQAVDGLIETADVILMDLRGFSEANKGCAYEVNVLFDNVPAERIVFMGYKNAVPLIQSVIAEQWEELSETSPNLHSENPYTRLYVVQEENQRNVQTVVQWLLETRTTS